MKTTPEMHQRWLLMFADLKKTTRAQSAGLAVKQAIAAELAAMGFSDASLREELAAHRSRVVAAKRHRYRKQAAECTKRWREKNLERARAASREHSRAKRAAGLDRTKERQAEALKRAKQRNSAIQSLEDLLRERAARAAERAAVKAKKAADKAAATEAREAYRRALGPSRLDRRRARDRVRKMEWKYRAYRKLGRNAHRMPELVELYKTTCELKRASR